MKKSNEPYILFQGKKFHKLIQDEWLLTSKDGNPISEKTIKKINGRNGRMDILVEDLGDIVSIIEIKATNWDIMKEHNIRRNVKRHCRQIWGYVDAAIGLFNKDVCPGIIFPSLPKSCERLKTIETLFNDEGIQVVWHNESTEKTRTLLSNDN